MFSYSYHGALYIFKVYLVFFCLGPIAIYIIIKTTKLRQKQFYSIKKKVFIILNKIGHFMCFMYIRHWFMASSPVIGVNVMCWIFDVLKAFVCTFWSIVDADGGFSVGLGGLHFGVFAESFKSIDKLKIILVHSN